jgi:hypothetical protein
VKTTLFAAALVAAVLSAASVSVIAAAPGGGDETTLAQSAAPVPAPGPETGQRMMRPGMHHPEMMERMMRHLSSQERCIDRLAHRAGFRAYLGVRLNLTAAQRPLWDKLQAVAENEEQQERQICDHLKSGEAATILDRMDARQQLLAARAAGLQAAKEPLAALYKALTPEQRAFLDHPHPFFHRP